MLGVVPGDGAWGPLSLLRVHAASRTALQLAAEQTLNTLCFLPFLVKVKIPFGFLLVTENRY